MKIMQVENLKKERSLSFILRRVYLHRNNLEPSLQSNSNLNVSLNIIQLMRRSFNYLETKNM